MLSRSSTRFVAFLGGALLIFTLLPAGVLAAASPIITSPSSTTFVLGTAGTFTVTANGTPVISIGESGVLPNGVTFTDNGDGTATLAGTPTVIAGSYPLTITASNGVGSDAVQAFTLKVSGSTGAPSITSAAGARPTPG